MRLSILSLGLALIYQVSGAELQVSEVATLSTKVNALIAQSPATTEVTICLGTNDWTLATPLGEWFTYTTATVNRNGTQTSLRQRIVNTNATTYRGCLNIGLKSLKEQLPKARVILQTPYVDCVATNANSAGLLLGDYMQVLRESANVWSIEVVDYAGMAPQSEQQPTPATESLFRTDPACTNRVPCSVGVSLNGCPLDSRHSQWQDSACVCFNTDEKFSLSINVR